MIKFLPCWPFCAMPMDIITGLGVAGSLERLDEGGGRVRREPRPQAPPVHHVEVPAKRKRKRKDTQRDDQAKETDRSAEGPQSSGPKARRYTHTPASFFVRP